MRTFVRPFAAVLAATYLLAGWLAGALHSHAPAVGGTDGVCTTCACGHDHGPRHAPPPAGDDREQDENHENHEDGHDCVVCHFFAQPPLAVASVSLMTGLEPVTPAAEPARPAGSAIVATAWWSRGPPAA